MEKQLHVNYPKAVFSDKNEKAMKHTRDYEANQGQIPLTHSLKVIEVCLKT